MDQDRAFKDIVVEIRGILERQGILDKDSYDGTVTVPLSATARRTANLALVAANDQILKLADSLSRELNTRLEDLRELYREGRRITALEGVRALCKHDSWQSLQTTLRAKILRTAAIFELQAESDPNLVTDLVAQATEIDPEGDDRTVRALLAYKRGDHDEALSITEGADSLSYGNLLLALLLEKRLLKRAQSYLDELSARVETDAETLRLSAILALMNGDTAFAHENIDAALTLQPRWQTLREMSAIIDFWRSCAPAAVSRTHPFRPFPFADELIRVDDEARERRRRAAAVFAELETETEEFAGEASRFRVWRFLCLAQDRETMLKAQNLLEQTLVEDDDLPFIVVWALARGIPFDSVPIEQALRSINPSNPITWTVSVFCPVF